MSIPIEQEDPRLYRETKVYEDCVFCGKNSKYWHKESNSPVCQSCSKIRKVHEISLAKKISYEKFKEKK